eukprot:433691-Hanusia_phi.AAC.1
MSVSDQRDGRTAEDTEAAARRHGSMVAASHRVWHSAKLGNSCTGSHTVTDGRVPGWCPGRDRGSGLAGGRRPPGPGPPAGPTPRVRTVELASVTVGSDRRKSSDISEAGLVHGVSKKG